MKINMKQHGQRTCIQAANVNESKEGTEQQKTGTNKPQQHKHNYDTNPKHREYYFKTKPKSGKPVLVLIYNIWSMCFMAWIATLRSLSSSNFFFLLSLSSQAVFFSLIAHSDHMNPCQSIC